MYERRIVFCGVVAWLTPTSPPRACLCSHSSFDDLCFFDCEPVRDPWLGSGYDYTLYKHENTPPYFHDAPVESRAARDYVLDVAAPKLASCPRRSSSIVSVLLVID